MSSVAARPPRRCALLLTGALAAAAAGPASASGLETAGIGARGRGLGYSLVAAADDWTAVYYNPAGLAWTRGGEAAALYEYFSGGLSSTASLRNLPAAAGPDPRRGDYVDPVGDEPRAFARRDVHGFAHAAELGWAARLGPAGVAAGLYGSGAGSEWEDRAPTAAGGAIDAGFSFRNLSVNLPVGAGLEVVPGLALGAAVTCRYGLLDAEVRKERSGDGVPYVLRSRQETAGTAASLDVGALWRPGGDLSLGAVWRFPYRIVKRGATGVAVSLAGLDVERDTRVAESIPARATLGAAWHPRAGDLLTLSVTWMDWSAYRRETSYDDPVPGVLEDGGGNPAGWGDTVVVGGGYERALGTGWTGRAGLVWDQAPEPREHRTLVGGQVVDTWKAAVGLGWEHGPAAVDVGYTRSWSSGVPGYLPGADYRLSLHEVYAAVRWRF